MARRETNSRRKVGYAYLAMVVAVIILLTGYWEYQVLNFRDKEIQPAPPLEGALTLGPIFVGSNPSIYNLTVVFSTGMQLIDLGFAASNGSGGKATILSVCVTAENGVAIGTWNGSVGVGWAKMTTMSSFVCSNGGYPFQQRAPGDGTLSTLDDLYFYLARSLDPGSMLEVTANGVQFQGSVVQRY